jgi:hypothetical protein
MHSKLQQVNQGCQMVYFSNQKKKQFGLFFEGLRMEKVGVFYGPLECIAAIYNTLWSFCDNLIYFPRFGVLCQENLAALK